MNTLQKQQDNCRIELENLENQIKSFIDTSGTQELQSYKNYFDRNFLLLRSNLEAILNGINQLSEGK